MIARQSIISLVIAAGCLLTTFAGKPLLGLLLKPTFDLLSPHHAPAWERCWDDDPQFRQKIRTVNFVVGVTTAASALSRIYVVYHTSSEVAIIAGGLPSLAIWAVVSPVLLRIGRPAFETMRRTRKRLAAEAAEADHEAASCPTM